MRCSLKHEKKLRAAGYAIIAGIDEAGCGPLAGPVVAAAVVLPGNFRHKVLNDSKQVAPEKREAIFEELTVRADVAWAVSVVAHDEIDRFNILRAAHLGMKRAVEQLPQRPDHVLIDGRPVHGFPVAATSLVKGDALSFSIAAASIVAKVTRDRLMLAFDVQFPEYGFAQHKGYGTPLHLERLRTYGPCPIHRRSFLPVQQLLLRFD